MRHLFGGIADYVIAAGDGDTLVLVPGQDVTFWSAASGGTQYTDLVDLTDVAISGGIVTTDGSGALPQFRGPDGVTLMYADAGGGRRAVVAVDVGASVTDLDALTAKLVGVGRLFAGPTEPADAVDGDVWFDTGSPVSSSPVAYRSSSSVTNLASSADTTCQLPVGVQVGDVMLMAVVGNSNGTITVTSGPAGWTAVPGAGPTLVGSTDTISAFYWRVYEAGDTAATVTMGGSQTVTIGIVAYSGAAGSLHAVGTPGTRANASTGNTTTAPGVTTTAPDTVVIGMFIERTSTTTQATDPAGTTRRQGVFLPSGTVRPSVLVVDADQAAAGASSAMTATYLNGAGVASPSDNGRGIQIALGRAGA